MAASVPGRSREPAMETGQILRAGLVSEFQNNWFGRGNVLLIKYIVWMKEPIFTRKDTRQSFQWRIRNLPYPIETYSLSLDQDNRCCIIRTSNKKYYKKFSIPDMDRAGLLLQDSRFTMAHSNNTLIITYKKPVEILTLEKQVIAELQKTKNNKEGDMECAPS